MTQFVASSFGEFGVQSQYLDGELHLVDDSLAGTVATGEKFKIFRRVVGFYSVDVMNCLFGEQSSPNALFHDVAVFQHISRWFGPSSRYYESDVAPASFAPSDFLVRIILSVRKSAEQRSAFRAAQRLLAVHRAARLSLHRHLVAALNADNVPVFVRQSASNSSAFSGTVHRIFAKFFAVLSQVRGFVFKRCAADFAGERGDLRMRRRSSVSSFMDGFARSSAKTLVGVRGFDLERGQALFTAFFDRHLVVSLFAATSVDTTNVCLSK